MIKELKNVFYQQPTPLLLLQPSYLYARHRRSSGKSGTAGPQGPQGPQGEAPDDSFASFGLYQGLFTPGSLIPMYPDITDPTGNIVSTDPEHISLAPGYYLVSYKVSALFNSPNYMQVTPFYNGTAHLDKGTYFATTANGASADGSAFMIIKVTSHTEFSLNYSGSGTARDGQVNITFLKLNSPL